MAGLRGRKNYVQAAVDALNAGDYSTPIQPCGTALQRKILRALEKLRVTTLEQQIAHARAIEQNKLAIASVAHDVKTPLALISGYAECLQDGMDDKDYLALITEKTEQLNGLVLKLVETSKHEIDEIDSLKEKVDTRMFLGAVLDKFESLARAKNISYKVRRIPSVEIYADRRELERVFQNLISNAVKYTEEGGKITVSFEHNGKFFIAKVKDTGKGIEKKNLPYVFDKFFMEESSRTDSKNSGLGLYVAQQIAHRHGGEIRVRSKKGKGSVFSVRIPELPDETTPTQRFEKHPMLLKIILILMFCFIMPWLLRIIRFFETRRVGTLITGICNFVLWPFMFLYDIWSEILYNRIVLAMD